VKTEKAIYKGLTFFIRPGTSDQQALDEVIKASEYEKFRFAINPGENWLDMGCNIAAFTVLALSKGANVEAFEPDPNHSQLAAENIKANEASLPGYFRGLHEVGLIATSEKRGILSANVRKGKIWRNSVVKSYRNAVQIPVSLEHYEQYITPGCCLKIDIEGSEIRILQHLIKRPDLMTQIKKMVFEWSFDVDPDMTKFYRVVDALQNYFSTVKIAGVTSERFRYLRANYTRWQGNWNPWTLKVFVE